MTYQVLNAYFSMLSFSSAKHHLSQPLRSGFWMLTQLKLCVRRGQMVCLIVSGLEYQIKGQNGPKEKAQLLSILACSSRGIGWVPFPGTTWWSTTNS